MNLVCYRTSTTTSLSNAKEVPVFVCQEIDIKHFVELCCLVHRGCPDEFTSPEDEEPGCFAGKRITNKYTRYDAIFESLFPYEQNLAHVFAFGTQAAISGPSNPPAVPEH